MHGGTTHSGLLIHRHDGYWILTKATRTYMLTSITTNPLVYISSDKMDPFQRAVLFLFLIHTILLRSIDEWHVGVTVHAWTFSPPSSRRQWLQQQATAIMLGTGAIHVAVQPSLAADNAPTPTELERLRKGHARIQYLLTHWDEETQVCGKIIMSDAERKQVVRTEGAGSAGCEKTPLNVQSFMGYKSTEDPLYRADKLMVRAASLVDADQFENYLDVVEKYKDKADNSAMMAYTSSWGEANPNGGKEVIDEYLERTKLDVMESERYLRQILGYLHLEPLSPSKNP